MLKTTVFYFTSLFFLLLSGLANANQTTRYWSAYNENNPQSINHSLWNNFLQKYINVENDYKVRYEKVSQNDKNSLVSYIEQQTGINPLEYNRAEQYAYWVNLYNALTINVVLDHYPVSSIKKIKLGGSFFSTGPWKADIITINNQSLSLDDIEHNILRPIWKDPRTHYAVNCASIGCPNLANEAFTAENTDILLNQNAKRFINSNKGLAFDGNKIILSKIYSWFKEDFGTKQDKVFNHIKQYINDDRKELLQNSKLTVNYRYNWDLNDDK